MPLFLTGRLKNTFETPQTFSDGPKIPKRGLIAAHSKF